MGLVPLDCEDDIYSVVTEMSEQRFKMRELIPMAQKSSAIKPNAKHEMIALSNLCHNIARSFTHHT